MKRDWVKLGLLEVICGSCAIVVGLVDAFGLRASNAVIVGWGMIFVVIGMVLLIHGLRADLGDSFCPICGRRIKKGSMFCQVCNPPSELIR